MKFYFSFSKSSKQTFFAKIVIGKCQIPNPSGGHGHTVHPPLTSMRKACRFFSKISSYPFALLIYWLLLSKWLEKTNSWIFFITVTEQWTGDSGV